MAVESFLTIKSGSDVSNFSQVNGINLIVQFCSLIFLIYVSLHSIMKWRNSLIIRSLKILGIMSLSICTVRVDVSTMEHGSRRFTVSLTVRVSRVSEGSSIINLFLQLAQSSNAGIENSIPVFRYFKSLFFW